jgi:DtxR family Mn-dependent transcriptional regulator
MAAAKKDGLSASLEDYLEAIFNLAGEYKVAHSKDIAELLGVSKSSVTGALQLLKSKKLVNYRPYDSVTLTRAGREAAAKVARKHDILKSFFINVLGIEAGIAQQAACKAEHTLGPEVTARLLSFIEFASHNGKNSQNVADEFRRFYKNGLKDNRGRKSRKTRK